MGVSAQEFMDGIDNDIDSQMSKTPPRMEHPRAILFFLKQVEADNAIIDMYDKAYGHDMYCFNKVKDIPKLPNKIDEELSEELKEAEFDNHKWVCIVSPFVSMYRGFIVEVLTEEDAEEYIKIITDVGTPIKVHGWGKQYAAEHKSDIIMSTGTAAVDKEFRKNRANIGRVII